MTGLPSLEHVIALSDDAGIIQHAKLSVPNRSTGYCTDDVARAFIVALQRLRFFPNDAPASRLALIYLSFLHDAQLSDGRFHNFMGYDRKWLDEVGGDDSCGRAIWAIGYGVRFAPNESWQLLCRMLLDRATPSIDGFVFPRAQAYAMFGLAHALLAGASSIEYRRVLHALVRRAVDRYTRTRDGAWEWFEDELTYDNARLPEAVLRAGSALQDARAIEVGMMTLSFLERIVFEDGIFVPIGNEGWYVRGGVRARYAQQPLEAAAMVDAELAAFDAGANPERLAAAENALAWFYGRNSRNAVMSQGGGCYDGLHESGPNLNMGAESTLAHLSAAYALAEYRGALIRVAR
jgi:hypothetical protein